MEREKQKKMDKERQKKEREEYLQKKREEENVLNNMEKPDASKAAAINKIKLEAETEELKRQMERNVVKQSKSRFQKEDSPEASPAKPPKPEKEPSPAPEPPKSREELVEEVMLKVRRTLTQILLEVTTEEMTSVAREVYQKARGKAPAMRPRKTQALASIAGRSDLGLGMYGSDDSESENSDRESKSSRKAEDSDSETELQILIQRRKENFAKTAQEIEHRLAEEMERERKNSEGEDSSENDEQGQVQNEDEKSKMKTESHEGDAKAKKRRFLEEESESSKSKTDAQKGRKNSESNDSDGEERKRRREKEDGPDDSEVSRSRRNKKKSGRRSGSRETERRAKREKRKGKKSSDRSSSESTDTYRWNKRKEWGSSESEESEGKRNEGSRSRSRERTHREKSSEDERPRKRRESQEEERRRRYKESSYEEKKERSYKEKEGRYGTHRRRTGANLGVRAGTDHGGTEARKKEGTGPGGPGPGPGPGTGVPGKGGAPRRDLAEEYSERSCYSKGTQNSQIKSKSRASGFLNSRRQDNYRPYSKEQKYWQSSAGDKYKYNRRDKKSIEREDRNHSPARRYNFREHDRSRSSSRGRTPRSSRNDYNFRHRHSRSSDSDSGSTRSGSSDYEYVTKHRTSSDRLSSCSRSNDRDSRQKRSGSGDRYSRFRRSRSRSRASRSPEWKTRLKSPVSKFRKAGASSRNFDKSSAKSRSKWDFQHRQRRSHSFSKSPTPVRKRLGNRISPGGDDNEKNLRNFSIKKQGTPVLVDLEREVEGAKRLMNSEKEVMNGPKGQVEVSKNINDNSLVPETRPTQNLDPIPPYHQQYNPPLPKRVYGFHFQYTFPTMSVNNLPLVLGPTGVPVHITMRGTQIPHDFDGRPIPLGPNGHYLPLDPTGRLFAHIIFPENQAVPIHMTEDGVLRLPNSTPVPYGPQYQFPVNIDGRIIPIGPDSKPLFPCPNLPRQPPQFRNSNGGFCPEHTPREIAQVIPQMVNQQVVPIGITGHHCQDNVNSDGRIIPIGPDGKPLQLCPELPNQPPQHLMKMTDGFCSEPTPPQNIGQTGNQIIPAETQQSQSNDSDQPQIGDPALVDAIPNPGQKIGEADVVENYKGREKKRPEDVLLPTEVEKKLEVNSSKEAAGRSSPMELSVKRISIESNSDSDTNLETDDSYSALDLITDCKSKEAKEISKTPRSREKAKPKGEITKKVQRAIQLLRERHYNPPVFGRFIISSFTEPVAKKCPEESPLLRNRIMLPFLNPNARNPHSKDQSIVGEKTEITFKFLPPKVAQKGDEPTGIVCDIKSSALRIPVFKFDFAMQCDFTSLKMKRLNSKITELKKKVVVLKNINTNLLRGYKNIQTEKERKSNQLRRALVKIGQRNNEVRALQRSLAEREKLVRVSFIN